MSKSIMAWHFVGEKLRNGRDIPPDGKTLVHKGPLKLCVSGLHASERLMDALQYAPGNTVCRVKCHGTILKDTDKLICTRRTIEWRLDATELLRSFARQCALDVAHLWDMPDVVRQYLTTGDESLRAAARDAASDAAWVAGRVVAATAAANDAAWVAASDATAARDAAWVAARAVSASEAASDAVWVAARVAAIDAAWITASDAAGDAQNDRLTAMIEATKP